MRINALEKNINNMKLLYITLLATSVSLQAVTTTTSFGNGASTVAGSFGITSAYSSGVYTYTFSSNAVDLDGNGTADESLSFDIVLSQYDSSTLSGSTLTLGAQNTTWTNGSTSLVGGADTPSDTAFHFAVTNVSYAAGASATGSTLDSVTIGQIGYSGAENGLNADLSLADGHTVGWGTELTNMSSMLATAGNGIDFTGLDDGVFSSDFYLFTDLNDDVAATRDRFVGLDINIDVTPDPIPEPTSSALLGLGGLALLSRRKR